MSSCQHCGSTVPESAVYCGNCGAAKSSVASVFISVSQATAQESGTLQNSSASEALQSRLEKAMRRAELLSYAVVGLGVALLAVIIGISVL
jgi:uncharacterized membrane protein YvbJ